MDVVYKIKVFLAKQRTKEIYKMMPDPEPKIYKPATRTVVCWVCRKKLSKLEGRYCNFCGKAICPEHTLPEKHDCECVSKSSIVQNRKNAIDDADRWGSLFRYK